MRYYKKEGLLSPKRDVSGHRHYDERDVQWTAFILRLKQTNSRSEKSSNTPTLRQVGDDTLAERYSATELTEHQAKLIEQQQTLTEHQNHISQKIATYGQ